MFLIFILLLKKEVQKILKKDGFTLIEILLALSITSIIIISFSSILLNSVELYEKEIAGIEEVQKSFLFRRWLNEKIKNSSLTYLSDNDGLLTIKESGNNILFKLVKYNSGGEPALGIEKYEIEDNLLRYIEKEPIINGINNIKIEEIDKDLNSNPIFNLKLNFSGSNKIYQSIIYKGD